MKILLFGIESMLRGYIDCALWSADDEATGRGSLARRNFVRADLASSTEAVMRAECAAFLEENLRYLGHQSFEQFGHDFWLTRNHHGAGFWDGSYPELDGESLTHAAHAAGERDLYVGDDGQIYQVQS